MITYKPLLPDLTAETERLKERHQFFQDVIEATFEHLDQAPATQADLCIFVGGDNALRAAKRMLDITNWQLHELELLKSGSNRCLVTGAYLNRYFPL